MKKFYFLISIFALFFATTASFSQTNSNQLQNNNEITVVVTYNPNYNPLILQVLELTGGDEFLTELVIYDIQERNSRIISKIITDEEYNSLAEEKRYDLIKESEVIQIINQLKN